MSKMKLLSLLMLGGSIVACGGGGDGDGGDPTPPIIEEPEPEEGSQIEIQTENLPLRERFNGQNIASFQGLDAVDYFFSENYKALNTPASHELEDADGNAYTLTDPNPSFYYPTCCLYAENEAGEYIEGYGDTAAESWKIGDGMLMMGDSARFTIGQVLSDLTDSEAQDRKSDTSNGAEGASVTAGSWGELKLDEAYRVSFCVNDTGVAGTGTSNVELFVDNNSGGRQDESIHAAASLLLRTPTLGLESGNRVVVNVPGEAYQVDDAGERVGGVLAVSDPLDDNNRPVGTHQSFLQLRVSSGAYAVISDLVVEYQDDQAVEYDTCEVNEDFYEGSAAEGAPFLGMPHEVTIGDMTTEEFFGEEGTRFLAISDDKTDPFYKVISGSSRTFIEDGNIRFGNSYWTMGMTREQSALGDTTAEDEVVHGDMDLSADYTISMEIVAVPPASGGDFQVQVDNNDTSSGASIHGAASQLLSVDAHDALEPGTLVINVPGAVTLNGEPLMVDGEAVTIENRVGTENSFLWFRCSSGCGDADEAEANGITVGDISVTYQGEGPGADEEWTGEALPLMGESDPEPSGSVTVNEADQVTITTSGGNVSSSNHHIYFAHQLVEESDFSFTARVASIEGANDAVGNSYRFGMMAMSKIQSAGTAADLGAWADIGFYVDEASDTDPTPTLFGSRGNNKPGGSRTRSDISDIGEGDWLRIEIYDEVNDAGEPVVEEILGEQKALKRVKRYVSRDNGATWSQENSTTDFKASADDDSWYVGFYGAPGTNDVTVSFDNISIEPLADE